MVMNTMSTATYAQLLPWIQAQLKAFQIRLGNDPLPADGIVICDDGDLLAMVAIALNQKDFRTWEGQLRRRCSQTEADALVIFIPDDLPNHFREDLLNTPFESPVRVLCIPSHIMAPSLGPDSFLSAQTHHLQENTSKNEESRIQDPSSSSEVVDSHDGPPHPDEVIGAVKDVDHAVIQQPFAEVMKELRPRLLDLGLRNRLLNYLPSGGITVVDELPDEIIRILVANKRAMMLDDTGERDTVTHSRSANPRTPQLDTDGQMLLNIEEPPSAELPAPTRTQAERRHRDSHLQTNLSQKSLQARGTTVFRRYGESIQAYGIKPLYLALGFLQWFEAEQADTQRIAPLILIPIEIKREKVTVREAITPGDQDFDARSSGTQYRTVTRYRFSITYTDDPIVPNLSLQAKLLRDFDLVLPELPGEGEDIEPEVYFQRVRGMLARSPDRRWTVKRVCSIGFFNFTKEVIHEDLGNPGWTEDGAGSQLIEMLTGSQDTLAVRNFEQHDIEQMHAKGDLPLVYDADSSQCAAIRAALEARTLVVHGPPGTGKSQSITNLIGAAMAQGLRVLFVAAKDEALKVVADRLERAGLGPFLLSLYSHKTRPMEVLENIRTRVALQVHRKGSIDDPCKKVLAATEPSRRRLADYIRLIERPSGVEADDPDKIFDFGGLLYHASRCQEDFRTAWVKHGVKGNSPILQLSIPIATYANRKNRESAEELLRDVVDLAQANSLRLCRPWHGWQVRPLLGDTADEAMDAISMVPDALDSLADTLRSGPLSIPVETLPVLRFTEQLRAAVEHLPEPNRPSIPEVALQSLILNGAEQITNLLNQIRLEDTVKARLGTLLPDAPSQPQSLLDSLPQRLLGEELIPSIALTDLVELHMCSSRAVEAIQQLVTVAESVLEQLQITMDLRWRGAQTLGHIAELLARADSVQMGDLDPRFLTTTCAEQLMQTREKSTRLQDTHKELAKQVAWTDVPSPEKVAEFRRLLRVREGAWYAWTGIGQLAQVRRECRAFLRITDNDFQRSTLLERIEVWHKANTDFVADSVAGQRLGPLFCGIETDWNRIERAMCLTQDLLQCLGYNETLGYLKRCQSCTLDPDMASSLTSAVAAASAATTTASELLSRMLTKGSVPTTLQQLDGTSCTDSAQAWQKILEECKEHITWWEKSYQPGSPWRSRSLSDLRQDLMSLLSLHQTRKHIADHPHRSLLGSEDPSTRLSEAQASLGWAVALVGALQTQPMLVEILIPAFRDPTVTLDLQPFRNWITTLIPLHLAVDERLQALETYGSCDSIDAFSRTSTQPLVAQRESIAERIAAAGHLVAWSRIRSTTSRAEELGCTGYISLVEREEFPAELLIPAFRSAIFFGLGNELLRRVPELAAFDAVKLERWRQSFRNADADWTGASRQKIAAQLLSNEIPNGTRASRAADLSGYHLLTNELGKQRRHVSVRHLVHRAGEALLALKPCWLMSPLSVSSFLPRQSEMFDLVVMDEASQVRTEEALGAILRAKSVIIFGDPKQMPPTDFFSTGLDEEGETLASGSKSILDLAIQTLPESCNKHLTWHYRSLHQDLIAYSNAHFYRNGLVIFPSRLRQGAGLGITWVPCGGRFAGGRNTTEAEAVADVVLKHARNMVGRPPAQRESLGVVAMNREQADLISELLDAIDRKGGPDAAALAALSDAQEALFIRNLETVQGDERDHIIISCTYGPDSVNGKVYQRFGPILRTGGERRLNVLFSRSKRRMTVVSSLEPEQIITGRSLGAQHFRGFLAFAKSGVLNDAGRVSGRDPDSDFEVDVGRAIIELGYTVEYQVGVNGFFIDIGVVNPKDPGHFLIGIECDGATFHSSRVARDRDRLRQEILESRGWTLHRIWSTEWFQNRAGCIAQLKDLLDKHATGHAGK